MNQVAGRRRARRTAGFAIVVCLAAAGAAVAGRLAAVQLDSKFGRGGIVKPGTGQIFGIAAQRDGGAVAVGNAGSRLLVLRIDQNGAHRQRLSAGRGIAKAVVIQRDGKILVAGTSAPRNRTPAAGDMLLERFNANGSIDRRFGSGGVVHMRGAIANAVALGPRGTIVIAGSVAGADGFPRVGIARLRSNGGPDTSFGSSGFALIDLGPYSQANGVVVGHDGKIVIAGDQSPGLQQVNALVARITAGGSLDRSFGNAGAYYYFHPHGGGASSFEAVTSDSAGRILAAGGDVENSGQHALFVRLTPRGAPDLRFGSRGILTTRSERDFTGGQMIGARGIAIAGHNEIVAAGNYLNSAVSSAALWAITPSGRLDRRAGAGGLTKTAFPGLGAESWSVAVAPNGNIYSGGDIFPPPRLTALVARYRGFGRR